MKVKFWEILNESSEDLNEKEFYLALFMTISDLPIKC